MENAERLIFFLFSQYFYIYVSNQNDLALKLMIMYHQFGSKNINSQTTIVKLLSVLSNT